MDPPGQSSSSSRNSNHPGWRTNKTSRPSSSDDERQFSRKTFIPSSANPRTNSSSVAPGYSNSQPRPGSFQPRGPSAPFSSTQVRHSLPRPDGYRVQKSTSTPSMPYQYASSSRPPLPQQSRSNPTAPVWDFGPSRGPRNVNAQQTPRRHPGPTAAPATHPRRGPLTKASSTGPPMWNPANEPRSLHLTAASRARITPSSRPSRPQMEITKSSNHPTPFWQHQDAEHEAQKKVEHRIMKQGELGGYHAAGDQEMITPNQRPPRTYLSPTLRVVEDRGLVEGEGKDDGDDKVRDGGGDGGVEQDEDVPMDVDEPAPPAPQPRGIKTVTRPRINLAQRMAARKTKWPGRTKRPPSTSESDSESLSSSSDSSDSSSSSPIIELTDSESDKDDQDNRVKPESEYSDSEIQIIDPPKPLITIPLPQIAPASPASTPVPPGPPEELVAALSELCEGSIRMQETKQLPFLLRNLRKGFRLRCGAVGIKTTRTKPRMPVVVRYEYTERLYESRMSRWFCPLCELHGAFPNKEMLRCHLHWDHAEVILERWEQRANNQGKSEWRVHLLIPEVLHQIIQPRRYDELVAKLEFHEPSIEPEASPSLTPPRISKPQDNRQITPATSTTTETTTSRKLEPFESVKVKTLYSDRREIITPRTHRPSITPSVTITSDATQQQQQTTELLSTIRIEHTPGPPGGLYPSPPVDDPLGPAAKRPYLPATSEYDGPDMHYSCRPGGESVFDLLGTLPMEPFGVLEWDILEREEEIFESDDIKVEYKVMHALWLRWIMLNRTEFMRNYYKGVIAFIDAYWRMIHQAAGWGAMRYWLLLLLSQRFLTGREVARALKHYEKRTGMEHWESM